uniref:Uncharacterized protein n=1 Tax=Ditylenchus dipsaci TaxID=166011 RepID=A0A915E5H1_9BILA
MAAAARETAQQNQQKPSIAGLSNANKASYTPNASIVPMSTSSSSTATATASVIGPLKSDSAIVINGASINGSLVPAASMGHSGPDDERFQAFLASIRLQYEQQLQQQAEINKTIINVNVAASLAQTQLPKSDEIKDIEKPQENSVTKAQQIKQDAPNSPTCVDQ